MANYNAASIIRSMLSGEGVALGAATYGTHVASGIAGRAGQDVANGAAGTVSSAVNAGAKIGQAIIEGIAAPFGKSGAAVASLTSLVSQTFQSALSGALNFAGNAVGAGGKVVGAVVGGVGSLAGAGIGGMLAGPTGVLAGAAIGSLVSVAVMKVIESIAGVVSTSLKAVGAAFGAFGDLATGALRTISDVISDVTQNATKLSQSALAMSQQSGMPLSRSAGAFQVGAALGVSQGAIEQGGNQNTMIQRMRDRMMGISAPFGTKEGFLQFADRYKSMANQGPMGLMFAQSIAANTSYASPEWQQKAMLPTSIINRQFAQNDKMQSALGLRPEEMRSFAQDFALFGASVSNFVNLVKNRIAADLLPYLTAGLNTAIEWIGAHSKDIAEGIKSGVHWLVHDLPPMLMHGAAFMVRGFATVLDVMGNVAKGIQTHVPDVLKGIDAILNGLRTFAANAWGVGSFLKQLIANVAPTFGQVVHNFSDPNRRSDAVQNAEKYGLRNGLITLGVATAGGAVFGQLTGKGWVSGAAQGFARGIKPALAVGAASAGYGFYQNITEDDAAYRARKQRELKQQVVDQYSGGAHSNNFGMGGSLTGGDDTLGLLQRAATKAFADRFLGGSGGSSTQAAAQAYQNNVAANISAGAGSANNTSPFDAFNAARQDFLNTVPESNFAGNYTQTLSDAAGRAGDWLHDKSQSAGALADSLDERANGWAAFMDKMDRSIAANERAARAAERGVDATNGVKGAMSSFARATINQAATEDAQDTYFNRSRGGNGQ